MTKKTKNFEEGLLARLKNPSYAAGYLDAALSDEEEGAEERFLLALRDVAKAYGMTQLSDESLLNRQNLYKTLSEKGNPELKTLTALLKAMGLRLAIEVEDKAS